MTQIEKIQSTRPEMILNAENALRVKGGVSNRAMERRSINMERNNNRACPPPFEESL